MRIVPTLLVAIVAPIPVLSAAEFNATVAIAVAESRAPRAADIAASHV